MATTSLSRWATRAAASLPSTHTQPSAVIRSSEVVAVSGAMRPSLPPGGPGSKDLPAAGLPGRLRIVDIGVQDVAHRQHPDQLAAADHGQVADAQLQHDVGGIDELAVGPQDLRGRGHVVGHRRHFGVSSLGQGRRQVPLGDDADQALALQDREGAHLVPAHPVGRRLQRLLGLGGEQLVGSQVGDLHRCLLLSSLWHPNWSPGRSRGPTGTPATGRSALWRPVVVALASAPPWAFRSIVSDSTRWTTGGSSGALTNACSPWAGCWGGPGSGWVRPRSARSWSCSWSTGRAARCPATRRSEPTPPTRGWSWRSTGSTSS